MGSNDLHARVRCMWTASTSFDGGCCAWEARPPGQRKAVVTGALAEWAPHEDRASRQGAE